MARVAAQVTCFWAYHASRRTVSAGCARQRAAHRVSSAERPSTQGGVRGTACAAPGRGVAIPSGARAASKGTSPGQRRPHHATTGHGAAANVGPRHACGATWPGGARRRLPRRGPAGLPVCSPTPGPLTRSTRRAPAPDQPRPVPGCPRGALACAPWGRGGSRRPCWRGRPVGVGLRAGAGAAPATATRQRGPTATGGWPASSRSQAAPRRAAVPTTSRPGSQRATRHNLGRARAGTTSGGPAPAARWSAATAPRTAGRARPSRVPTRAAAPPPSPRARARPWR